MESEYSQTQTRNNSELIQKEFKELAFTRSDGNTHYTADSPERLQERRESIKRFLDDESLVEPDSAPTKYSAEIIAETAARYEGWLYELTLTRKEARTQDTEILIDRIIAKLGELYRYEELYAAAHTDTENAEYRRAIAADHSMELIGGIDKDSFGRYFNKILDDIDNSNSQAAKDLRALIGDRVQVEADSQEVQSDELERKTREVLRADLFELFPGLLFILRNAPEQGDVSVSAEDAIVIFQDVMRAAHLSEGWSVQLKPGKAAETSVADKKVMIGRDRAPFKNHQDAVAVAVHEVIVHAGRGEGATFAEVRDFEEGLATRLQQVISGEERTPGVQYYLAIGLQAGIDRGGMPRSFRETYEILWRREVLARENKGEEVDIEAVQASVLQQVQRTRRGGVVDTRDASYYLGAQKAARWLNEIVLLPTDQRQRALKEALTNRIDPTNGAHLDYIRGQ